MDPIISELILVIDKQTYCDIKHKLRHPDRYQWTDPKMTKALDCFQRSGLDKLLASWTPILAGTIPIGISVPGSDLDVICASKSPKDVPDCILKNKDKLHPDLKIESVRYPDKNFNTSLIAMSFEGLPIEVYVETIKTDQQNAFRHMLIEALLLELRQDLRSEVIRLKNQGLKTEPSFGIALGLCEKGKEDESYQILLDLLVRLEYEWAL